LRFTKMVAFGLCALGLAMGVPGMVRADFNLVSNGSFETSGSVGTAATGEIGYNTSLANWTSQPNGNAYGYNFIFNASTATTTGSPGQYGSVALWAPASGSIASPDGGNFIGADGYIDQGAITQNITGLIAGTTYAVSFYWAGAQQSTYTGAAYDSWTVSLGSQSQSTAVVTNASQGFTGWMKTTIDFNATSSSETLSFLAVGTAVNTNTNPSGVPPFLLLDGVSMNAVPEPSSLILMGVGLLALGGYGVRRRYRSTVA
jgi:hypothetical protein